MAWDKDDLNSLRGIIGDTLNIVDTFAGMKNLNEQITINQRNAEHAALLKRTEQDNRDTINNKVVQNKANLAEVDKLINDKLVAYDMHGITRENLMRTLKEDLPTDDATELFKEEEGRFTNDFRFLGKVGDNLYEQDILDTNELAKKNLLLSNLDNIQNELNDNTLHAQKAGTDLGIKYITDAPDIEEYMDNLPALFKLKKLNEDGTVLKDKDGAIQYEDPFEEGWNAFGQALLKEKHKARGMTYGFAPQLSAKNIKNAQYQGGQMKVLNQLFLQMRQHSIIINKKINKDEGQIAKDIGPVHKFNPSIMDGTVKQYENLAQVKQLVPELEMEIVRWAQYSDSPWLKNPESGWKEWEDTKSEVARRNFVQNWVNRYAGKDMVKNANGELVERARYIDPDTGMPNQIAGFWNPELVTDEVDITPWKAFSTIKDEADWHSHYLYLQAHVQAYQTATKLLGANAIKDVVLTDEELEAEKELEEMQKYKYGKK